MKLERFKHYKIEKIKGCRYRVELLDKKGQEGRHSGQHPAVLDIIRQGPARCHSQGKVRAGG